MKTGPWNILANSVTFLNILINKQRSLDCVLFCVRARRKLLERERSEVFCLCSRYNSVNYGAWYVDKALFGSPVTTCRLVCSEISPSVNEEKAREKSGKWSDLEQFGRWRYSFSSAPCFVL